MPANAKRARAAGPKEPVDEMPPIPESREALGLATALERSLAASDLTDLRDNQIRQWLQAVPACVDWVREAARASHMASLSAQATPAGGLLPAASLFPPSPVGSTVSCSVGAFPASPSMAIARGVPRIRSYDAAGALISIASALATVPWARLRGRKAEETGAAFEAACLKLLAAADTAVLTVPVVEAALRAVVADDTAAVYVAMSAVGLHADADVQAKTDASSMTPGEAAAEVLGGRAVPPAEVERVARIINAAAVHYPGKVVELLQHTVTSHFPHPRWPVLSHFEACLDLLLMLGGFPRPPKGYAVPGASGPVFGRRVPSSPPISPAPTSEALKPAVSSGVSPAGKPATPLMQPPALAFPVADHRALLLDGVFTKLVAMDAALSNDAKDAACVKRLRRLVGRTAAILSRSYQHYQGDGDDDTWLQALFTFHHSSVMHVADTKGVHMLVPLFVSLLEPHAISAFLHGCISHVEKLPASNVRTKVTATAHLGPLLKMLGAAFVKKGSPEADAQLCGIVRRVAKVTAKIHGKPNIAGYERFADSLFGVLTVTAEAFGFPVGGRGDVSDDDVELLRKRRKENCARTVRESATHVKDLFDKSLEALPEFGGKVTERLRRFQSTQVTVALE